MIGDEEGCAKRSADCYWLVPKPYFCEDVDGSPPGGGPHLPVASCVALGHDDSPGPLRCRNGRDVIPCPHGETCVYFVVGEEGYDPYWYGCPGAIPICWQLEE